MQTLSNRRLYVQLNSKKMQMETTEERSATRNPPSFSTSKLPFLGKPAIQTRRMAGNAPHKSETNPGPTTTCKQVWICDICHRQIQVRKQISVRCNRIEHWVHLRCAGFRLAQYTDTWTCHQHRESRLTTHTYITPVHPPRPWPKPPTHSPPTPPRPP